MSDPVESVEIEDVLSSIRRLVSEEPKPRPAPAEEVAPTDRLVLTPAFRVGADDDVAEAEEVQHDADPETAREAYVAEVPEGLMETAEEVEAEAEAEVHLDAEDPFEAEVAVEDDVTPAAWEHNSFETRVAELEATVADTSEDWAPSGSEDEIDLQPIEPDLPVDEAPAEEAQEASMFSEDAPSEEAVLDEETLRELVSEIVREELQGNLGQRITRNVRKLVRVEINRVLASRDFD